ncbi:O-antigen ligase family protein [bacterium]|nr:O-antigen ligase family protein [bacterium]
MPSLCLQLMALALLLISLYRVARQGGLIIKWAPLDILPAVFALLCALSTFINPYKHGAQGAFILVFSFVIFYFHLAGYFTIRAIDLLLLGLTGLGVFESIVGFYQAIFLGESRIAGTFYNPNHLAAFFVSLCMFIIARVIFVPSYRRYPVLKFVLLAVLGIAFFLTGSRGGLFAGLGGSLAILSLSRAKKKGFCLLALFLIFLVIIPNPLIKRAMKIHKTDIYALSRWSMWKSALDMIKDHTLFGVGLGNFKYFSHRYAFPVEGAWARYARVANYTHNEFLHLGAEMGLPGIVFFLAAFWIVFTMTLKKESYNRFEDEKNENNEAYGVQKALLVGIITLLLHSMVDFIFHIPPLIFMLMIFAVWIRQIAISCGKGNEFRIDLSRRCIRFIILILMFVPVFLAWGLIRQYQGYLVFSRADGQNLLEDIKYIEKAISLDFGCAPYHNSLGGAYFSLYGITMDDYQLESGVKEARLAQTLNTEDYRFPLCLGEGYLNLYQIFPEKEDLLDKAEMEFRRCQGLAPYHYQAFLGTGKVFFHKQKAGEAVGEFKRAVDLEPFSISGHYWLGLAFEKLGDSESAHSQYKRVIEIDNMELHKKASKPYEKGLIDFDMNAVYSKLNLIETDG